jgi:carboxyl-terminal processing protease
VVLQIAAPAADPPPTLDPGIGGQHVVARRDVTLVRELIKTESVQGDRREPDGRWEWMIEGVPGVALVRVTTFGERTAEELAAAADAIAETGDPQGIVIDLRGNPGGLLSAAIDVCDLFLDDGVIVHTRGRKAAAPGEDAAIETRRAAAGAKLAGVPMMVLVDGLTASAAEIVAACLQDSGRATLVGSRTFGKGTVQSILPLSDDRGLLKLTTSEYLRPSRANIHRRAGDGDDEPWGVSPDAGYEITPTAESNSRLTIWRRSRDAAGPVPANRMSGGLPRDLDPVLARGLEGLSARGPIAGEPDLRGEKETSRDDDDPAGPDA